MKDSRERFVDRHCGPSSKELITMLECLGYQSIEQLVADTIPADIRLHEDLTIDASNEFDYLRFIHKIAHLNQLKKCYLGQGYYGTITPSVIRRNIFENPAWYTQYTPYQAEIAQGRLEALLNFQTMVSDLTALPVANASLLDEATAAAEAMAMMMTLAKRKKRKINVHKLLVDDQIYPQTMAVLQTRAAVLGIEIVVAPVQRVEMDQEYFGVILQYPDNRGQLKDFSILVKEAERVGAYVCCAADLLSLCLLSPPGEWGAHIAVGNTQRFGVPMGYGGPHAAYISCQEQFTRQLPGRIIGVSVDRHKNPALRMALQTREQHIRRERATSNICTAQALLAIMASMYAVYHGPHGLRNIAQEIYKKTNSLNSALNKAGIKQLNRDFFDTLCLSLKADTVDTVLNSAAKNDMNFRRLDDEHIMISLDETTRWQDVDKIASLLIGQEHKVDRVDPKLSQQRSSSYLSHPVFNSHHSETQMMRYIKQLETKDLSLVHSMIPLGSCTMKLNAATELLPLSIPEFSFLHPFVPEAQAEGYLQVIDELKKQLCQITGFTSCSLQPNSGAQGEYAGLLTIRNYHQANDHQNRQIALIPSSAHGTNPASAIMAGMKVVVVPCLENGDIDVEALKLLCQKHSEDLACLMITYPSTHGVFEESIQEICDLIHQHGGMVYMDGANMNAQVGLTNPAVVGADICHLNLHKTFAIPHGGGGPGMGPICCNNLLAPHLPGHPFGEGADKGSISAAPYGSASILLISYAYIKLLGGTGLKTASQIAILNANYMKWKLEPHYAILFTGKNDRVAHELIIDIRPFNKTAGIDAEDVAKRLIDYGFHAPTMSWPVTGTIMIEPTESEGLEEINRFCEAMISIRQEIAEIESGNADRLQNVLKNAPHTLNELCQDQWPHPYTREKAAFPLPYLQQNKFWASVARLDNAHGDRNLICTCPPIADLAMKD